MLQLPAGPTPLGAGVGVPVEAAQQQQVAPGGDRGGRGDAFGRTQPTSEVEEEKEEGMLQGLEGNGGMEYDPEADANAMDGDSEEARRQAEHCIGGSKHETVTSGHGGKDVRFAPLVLPGPGDDNGGGSSDRDAHNEHDGNVQSNGRSNGSSRFIGVRAHEARGELCWRAQFSYRRANHCLGIFKTELEAAKVRDQAVVTFCDPSTQR